MLSPDLSVSRQESGDVALLVPGSFDVLYRDSKGRAAIETFAGDDYEGACAVSRRESRSSVVYMTCWVQGEVGALCVYRNGVRVSCDSYLLPEGVLS